MTAQEGELLTVPSAREVLDQHIACDGDVGEYILAAMEQYAKLKLEAERAAMPTIMDGPLSKPYPCWERPMTAAECRAWIDGEPARTAKAVANEREACAEIVQKCATTSLGRMLLGSEYAVEIEIADRLCDHIATAIRTRTGDDA